MGCNWNNRKIFTLISMTSELFFTLHFEARYSVIPKFSAVRDFYLMGNL